MKRIFILVSVIVVLFATLSAQNVTIVTEDSPPYNFVENGQLKGPGPDIVNAITKDLNINAKINVYPWARAYNMAKTQKNVLIFSMARNAARENMFKWVGIVSPYNVYFFKLASRSDVIVKSLDDAKKYNIGAVNADVKAQTLASLGFKNLDLISNDTINLKKLEGKRIDLMPSTSLTMEGLAKKLNMNKNDFVPVYKINELSTNLYMAFSKNTSDEIVNKFRESYKKLKANGTIAKIMDKYPKLK